MSVSLSSIEYQETPIEMTNAQWKKRVGKSQTFIF